MKLLSQYVKFLLAQYSNPQQSGMDTCIKKDIIVTLKKFRLFLTLIMTTTTGHFIFNWRKVMESLISGKLVLCDDGRGGVDVRVKRGSLSESRDQSTTSGCGAQFTLSFAYNC